MSRTCFVIMPIGTQQYDGKRVQKARLRRLYDDLIAEAIKKARPNRDTDDVMKVVRSDDISGPGEITSDIFQHIMDADYVVADITYPNPNVYYELGLRHASRVGTVLIHDKKFPMRPFDIQGLRAIPYTNTTTGLRALADQLAEAFDVIDQHPGRPDNPFLKVTEPRFALPPGGETHQILTIGPDGKPIWDWMRFH